MPRHGTWGSVSLPLTGQKKPSIHLTLIFSLVSMLLFLILMHWKIYSMCRPWYYVFLYIYLYGYIFFQDCTCVSERTGTLCPWSVHPRSHLCLNVHPLKHCPYCIPCRNNRKAWLRPQNQLELAQDLHFHKLYIFIPSFSANFVVFITAINKMQLRRKGNSVFLRTVQILKPVLI